MSLPTLDTVRAGDLKSTHPKVLIVGDSGSGKSWAAAKAGKRPLVLLVEAQAYSTYKEANPDAEVFLALDDEKRFDPSKVREFMDYAAEVFGDPNCPYDAVVIDGITEINAGTMDGILRSIAVKRNQPIETVKIERNHYGDVQSATERFLRWLRGLPVFVVVTALASTTIVDGKRLIIPDLLGKKLPPQIPRYFTAVGYAHRYRDESGKTHRFVDFDAPDGIVSKPSSKLIGQQPNNASAWLPLLDGHDGGPPKPLPPMNPELTTTSTTDNNKGSGEDLGF